MIDRRAAARSGARVTARAAPPPPPEPLRVPTVDSHTHLDMQEGTVEEALERAAAVGVTRLVQVGVDVESSRWSADVAGRHDAIWAAVAIHPNEAPVLARSGGPTAGGGIAGAPAASDAALDSAIRDIDALAALPQVRAVGETGLDYYRTAPEGVPAQQASFRRHIELAKRHGKALIIHNRDAHDDVLRILEEERPPDHVVFHCYSGDAAMARVCADHGYVLSFAGTVTFKSAHDLREAAAVAPLDALLVETDAPFLAPAPYRGRPNAPYLVPYTLRALARIKGVPEDTLAGAVTATAERVFGSD
ncbi:MAG: TatD family hydrolase [Streptomycetales bacterium]